MLWEMPILGVGGRRVGGTFHLPSIIAMTVGAAMAIPGWQMCLFPKYAEGNKKKREPTMDSTAESGRITEKKKKVFNWGSSLHSPLAPIPTKERPAWHVQQHFAGGSAEISK